MIQAGNKVLAAFVSGQTVVLEIVASYRMWQADEMIG